MKIASAPAWSPLAYASNAGSTCVKKAPRLGTEISDGSSSMSVCTYSGWSSASCAATAAPLEWPAMWAGRTTEMVEQRRGVGGVVGDAHRRRGVCASDPAALVVADELVAVGERRFCEQRQEAVRDDGADEQHRFARSGHLVFQVDAVDVYALHGSFSFGAGCCGPQPICVSKTVTAVTPTVTAGAGSTCVVGGVR